MFITREAILSNRIDGTQATFNKIIFAQKAGVNIDHNSDDLQEILNYIAHHSNMDSNVNILFHCPLHAELNCSSKIYNKFSKICSIKIR
ncbi:MAG: Fic/DOC family N-terminal domain-containing protein [Wolbachia sp.]